MDSIATTEAHLLYERLRRRDFDLRCLNSVLEILEEVRQYPLKIGGLREPGGKQFMARFQLGACTVFGRLVSELMNAIPLLYWRSNFTREAYDSQRQMYACELDLEEVPASWRDLVPGTDWNYLCRFMFALETGYVLLVRIIWVKIIQDCCFPGTDCLKVYGNSLRLRQRSGTLSPHDYLDATLNILSYTGQRACISLFASDIFDWWQDARLLPTPSSLANALAEATIAVFSFDFSNLRGDILGILYQSYFDSETRKALGECYEPPEVVGIFIGCS